MKRVQIYLTSCILLLSLGCASEEKIEHVIEDVTHGMKLFLEKHSVQLPEDLYDTARQVIKDRPDYDGAYRPVCYDHTGTAREISAQPGELLTIASGDPAIKDRSLAQLATNWQPYMARDFSYDCQLSGLDGPQMCSPVTFYYEYQSWLEDPVGPTPDPRPFMFFPTHISFSGEKEAAYRTIWDIWLKLRGREKNKDSLLELHKFISWLKGDERVKEIVGIGVPQVINSHFSGLGQLWFSLMMFPHAAGAEHPPTLPHPDPGVAIEQLLIRLLDTNPDYTGTYTAQYAVGMDRDDYKTFVHSTPYGGMYEDLRYTDDPVTLGIFDLVPDPVLKRNVHKKDPSRRLGRVLRSILYSSPVSMRRNTLGQPELNGFVHRPPSGLCYEEFSFFLHPSMLHTLDGSLFTAWSHADPMMPAQFVDFVLTYRKAWNEKYRDWPHLQLKPLQAIVHMEIYDSHLFVPHGDFAAAEKRLDALQSAGRGRPALEGLGYQVPDDWPCEDEADCPANPCATIECTPKNFGIRNAASCDGDEACLEAIADVFTAPYMGPFSRRDSSLAPTHRDPIVERDYDDMIAETMLDLVSCRARVTDIFIPEGCVRPDVTPVPKGGQGQSVNIGEPYGFGFNHLWTTGSMTTVHRRQTDWSHMPRYWSADNATDKQWPGMMSFRCYSGESTTFPRPSTDYGVAWFTTDQFGYFSDVDIFSDGEIDLNKINRSGRGDASYLMQYFPQRFLWWKSTEPFDEDYGSNLPNPSVGCNADSP